jgi:hypothetical protein
MRLIIECVKKPYEEEHTVTLKSLRLRCSKKEAHKLHKHYEKATDLLKGYWQFMSDTRGFDQDSFLEKKLKYRPVKVKGEYQVASRRFQRHKSKVPEYGRYYTHNQIFGMITDKLWHTRAKNELADYTDSMRLRFNTYLDWVKEYDAKYNEGHCVDQLDNLKVETKSIPTQRIEIKCP